MWEQAKPVELLPRLALIIGVAYYEHEEILPCLNTPILDADKMKELLVSQAGFKDQDVTVLHNPDRDDIFEALESFKELIDSHGGDCFAVLYYAGHGMLDNNGHYMLPTEWAPVYGNHTRDVSRALEEAGCRLDARSHTDAHLGAVEYIAGARAAVVLVDACRNNVWSQTTYQGWGVDISLGSSKVLACYACAPRATATDGQGNAHGPFTRSLLQVTNFQEWPGYPSWGSDLASYPCF
jgi:hypothetical protein